MSTTNLQVTLKSRPQGWVRESDFALVETPLPEIGDGEVLLKTLYLSLDPYMRGRMDDAKSYAKSVNLGEVMVGGTVSEVVQSRNPKFNAGDVVVSSGGWQRYSKAPGDALMRVPQGFPPSVFLGPAGMPGVTAWIGLFDIGAPKAGETVVVSAASGAVGSVVGQLAKEKGCRVVGIAGGPEKGAYVTGVLGFDACIDYKRDGWFNDFKEATPDGVDVGFENVGGEVLDNVLRRTNPQARIALCGLISDTTRPSRSRWPTCAQSWSTACGCRASSYRITFLAGPRSFASSRAALPRASSSIGKRSPTASKMRRRHSSACSRARTSASNW